MANIKITNLGDLKKQLQAESDRIFREFLNKALIGTEEIVEKVFLKHFIEHDVWRGLSGEFAGDKQKDLQAILGLTDNFLEAFNVLDTLGSLLKENMTVTPPKLRGSTGRFASVTSASSISFNITFGEVQEGFLREDFASYDSVSAVGESTLITWLEWLIQGGSVSNYQIIFDAKAVSRSGRAIMVQNSKGWSSSDSSLMNEGIDLIKNILSGEEFLIDLSLELEKHLISKAATL